MFFHLYCPDVFFWNGKKKKKPIRTWHVTSSSKDDTLGKWSWFSINTFHIDAVQSLSCARLVSTPRTAARQASLSFTTSWSLLKLMSIESVMPSHHLNLCHPLLLLPSVLSSIRVFSNESALHIRWAKYCSFGFSISPAMNIQDWSPSGETSWISFTSIAVWKMLSASFKVLSAQSSLQSTSHIRTWLVEKIIVLAIWTFGSKVTSLLFNTRLVWS